MKLVAKSYKNFSELAEVLNQNKNYKLVTVDGQNALIEDHSPEALKPDAVVSESTETRPDGKSKTKQTLSNGEEIKKYKDSGKDITEEEYNKNSETDSKEDETKQVFEDETMQEMTEYFENGKLIKKIKFKDGSEIHEENGESKIDVADDSEAHKYLSKGKQNESRADQ